MGSFQSVLDQTLRRAAWDGDLKKVEKLIEQGAGHTSTDLTGQSALHKAAQGGHLGVVEKLLEHGAVVDQQCDEGLTSLHMAAAAGHTDVAKCLLRHGADSNLQARDGRTALHWAALNAHSPVAELLMEFDADCNLVGEDGATAAELAQEKGFQDLGRILEVRERSLLLTLRATTEGQQVTVTCTTLGGDIVARLHWQSEAPTKGLRRAVLAALDHSRFAWPVRGHNLRLLLPRGGQLDESAEAGHLMPQLCAV